MFKDVVIVALSVICLHAGNVFADDQYFGAGVGIVDYSEIGVDDDASITILTGRLGRKINDYLSAEVRVAFGAGSDSVTALGQEVDVELNRMYGIYVRGGFPGSDNFYPYIVLGFSNNKVTASVNGFSLSGTESDNSYGIGAEFELGKDQMFNVEYMSYLKESGVEIRGLSIGFINYF